jgi:hypothetical protein
LNLQHCLNVKVAAADKLDRGGEYEEEGVLQGQAGQQAAQVRVLMVVRAHVHHKVHHDHLIFTQKDIFLKSKYNKTIFGNNQSIKPFRFVF